MKLLMPILFIAGTAGAKVQVQEFHFKKMPATKFHDASLALVKKHEQNKRWNECVSASEKAFKKSIKIRSWILLTWMKCAQKSSVESAILAIEQLDKNPIFLVEGPSAKLLLAEAIKTRLYILENSIKASSEVLLKQIDRLLALSLDRETRAKTLYFAGEVSMAAHQIDGAISFFQQSLEQNETKQAREKLSSIQLAMGIQNSKSENIARLEVLSEEEQKFEERFKSSLKSNDLISFVDDAVTYLNNFPNGRRAKWAYEKILDIYQNFSEKPDDEKFVNLKNRVLNSLEKMEAIRASDLARYLHRRNDFIGSLKLAEIALSKLSQSQMASTLLYVAGRSAQFIGDTKKAKKYFENYLLYHSSADDFAEVQFRLALVYFREEAYSSTIANLEKLLLSKASEKYELSARYWLYRSFQATKNQKAEEEFKKLIEAYPFSYYGLKLQLEKNGFIEKQADEFDFSKKVYFTSYQKDILDKALLLAMNGWVSEAISEISEFTLGDAPDAKILLAQHLKDHKVFSTAIRWMNSALEAEPKFRHTRLLTISFPEAYSDLIQTHSAKFKINPILIKSLIRQESAFNERATSVSKAMGLMQLIPPTAQEVAAELKLQKLELPMDAYYPENNIPMGVSYIAKMINKFGGNVPMGLAAYNAGPTRFGAFVNARPELEQLMTRHSSDFKDEIWFDEVPWMETSLYVKSILRNTLLYALLQNGKISHSKLMWQDLILASGPEKAVK